MHYLGFIGVPRRYFEMYDSPYVTSAVGMNEFISIAAFIVGAAQFILIYNIIKTLKTGKNLKDKIEGVSPYATWSSDSMYIFYTSKDSQTLRNDKIFRHQVGKNQKNEEIEKKIDKEVKEIINTKSYVKENVADDVPF